VSGGDISAGRNKESKHRKIHLEEGGKRAEGGRKGSEVNGGAGDVRGKATGESGGCKKAERRKIAEEKERKKSEMLLLLRTTTKESRTHLIPQ
jgi:hypothetical protein